MGCAEEFGQTTRLAIASWSKTVRLAVLMWMAVLPTVFLVAQRIP